MWAGGISQLRPHFSSLKMARTTNRNTKTMLKYLNSSIVFQEIPDEVTFAINITNCPCHCPGCHSQYLWEDIGVPLTPHAIDHLLQDYKDDITCICFMGGDAEPSYLNDLAMYIKTNYPKLHIGWYSGRGNVSSNIDRKHFDYIKVGPYIEHLGALKSPNTNQRLYKQMPNGDFEDITSRFWKK